MSLPIRIDGMDAWKQAARAENAHWAHDIERFAEPICAVRMTPKFTFTADQPVFCIGSCFARNVEEHLIYRGVRVLSKRLRSPLAEWKGRANGILNKFTTHSMLNELAWLEQPPEVTADLFSEGKDGWFDYQLATKAPAVSLERAIERRRYLTDDYFARLRQAEVVIITLGLVEAWWDGRSARYLNTAPSLSAVRQEPGRYGFEVLGVDSNRGALEDIHAILKRLNPTSRIVVTVSPVPLTATFTGRDPVVANMRSKSILRVVAEDFAEAHDDVDYFPSFEMISHAPRRKAFHPDCLHVADRAVGQVIGRFLEAYVPGIAGPEDYTTETAYLAANPDILERVRSGELESGFEHWVSAGRAEGRRLRPRRDEAGEAGDE